ncbi:ankyrin [Xylaria grammica]|nr:ankyrin [Xylaria grammica]
MSTTMSHLLGASSKKPDLTLFDEHRLKLRQLFLEQNKSLIEVKGEMEALHGFPETDVKTYEYGLRYLGFVKKLSLEGWVAVEALAKKRKECEGKRTEVYLSDVLQDRRKIQRIISRNKRSKQVQDRIDNEPTPDCPEGISLKTPPSSPNMIVINAQSLAAQVPRSLRDMSSINNEAGATSYSNRLLHGAQVQMISNPNSTVHWLCDVPSAKLPKMLWQILVGESRLSQYPTSYRSIAPRLPLNFTPAHDIAPTSQFSQQSGDADNNGNSIIHAHKPSFESFSNDCVILANSLDIGIQECQEILALLRINADRPILKDFFALNIPALAAAWINLVKLSAESQSWDAFQALVDVGFENHNSEWIQEHTRTLIELTVALGSKRVGKTAQRLISRNYVQNVPSIITDELLCNVARNLDAEMLSNFVAAGVTLENNGGSASAFEEYYKEIIDSIAQFARGSAQETQWIDLLKTAGFDFDIDVRDDLFLHKLSLWPDRHPDYFYQQPRPLPVDFSALDYLWFIGEYDLYETMANRSRRAQTHATVPRLITAAKAGVDQLTGYLNSERHAYPWILLEAALSVASGLGDVAAIKSFGEVGVDPNVRGLISTGAIGWHWHPLTRAAAAKCFNAVCVLVDMGADMISEIESFNPLLAAVSMWSWSEFERAEQLQIVQYFLDKGLAHRYGTQAIIEVAIPLAPEHRIDGRAPDDFIPDEEIIDVLCKTGISLDGVIAEDMDALHLAIHQSCNLKTVEFFLSRGAQIHSRCARGMTMLHSAAASLSADRRQIVELLLRKGADCTKECGELTILEHVLDAQQTKAGRQRGNEPAFQLFSFLRDNGAKHTDALLPFLLYSDAPDELIYQIAQAQVNFNELPRSLYCIQDMRPLAIAIWKGRLPLARQLLMSGADINAPAYRFGRTALQAACEPQPGVVIPEDFIQYLLSRGAQINARGGAYRRTALHCAIMNGSIRAFRLLIDSGADVHATSSRAGSNHELSSLDLAAGFDRLDMVDILLEKGAESYIQKRTPYDGAIKLANDSGNFAITRILERRVENRQD